MKWKFELEKTLDATEWAFALVFSSDMIGICLWRWGFSLKRVSP